MYDYFHYTYTVITVDGEFIGEFTDRGEAEAAMYREDGYSVEIRDEDADMFVGAIYNEDTF